MLSVKMGSECCWLCGKTQHNLTKTSTTGMLLLQLYVVMELVSYNTQGMSDERKRRFHYRRLLVILHLAETAR